MVIRTVSGGTAVTYQPKPVNELIEYLNAYGPPAQEDDRRFNRAVKDICISEPTPELVATVFRYLHQHSGPRFKDGNTVGRSQLRAFLERNLRLVEGEFLRVLDEKIWHLHVDLLRSAHRAGMRELAGVNLQDLVSRLASRDGHSLSVREGLQALAREMEEAG